MQNILIRTAIACSMLFFTLIGSAQVDSLRTNIGKKLAEISNNYTPTNRLRVNRITIDDKSKQIVIDVSEAFSYVPFRPENVAEIYKEIKSMFTEEQQEYKFNIVTSGMSIDDLIPNFYRKKNSVLNHRYSFRLLQY